MSAYRGRCYATSPLTTRITWSTMGWSSRRNGELLKLMLADRFEVLLTVDQNLPFQQDLRASGIGVVVVLALTNRVKELRPLIPKILDALGAVKPGGLVKVGG